MCYDLFSLNEKETFVNIFCYRLLGVKFQYIKILKGKLYNIWRVNKSSYTKQHSLSVLQVIRMFACCEDIKARPHSQHSIVLRLLQLAHSYEYNRKKGVSYKVKLFINN